MEAPSSSAEFEFDEGEMEAPSSSAEFEFDVFLSFRGKDTRKGFTGHLYDRLKLQGISAFMDSEDLEKGQEIKKLMDYIERSMIFMPIFSKGYAASIWCLKEITTMVACQRLIIPVFFDIEPAEVRDQTKHFASAFERYEKDADIRQEVSNWRCALKTVGELSGFHLKNDTCGDEAKLVLLIVKRLLSEVRKLPFLLPKNLWLFGFEDHAQEVKELLSKSCSTVRFIGIRGREGTGKTTIAKAIYNDLFLDFEASSFLFNIGKNYQRHRELELQRQLTRDILKSDERIYSVEEGRSIIKHGMKAKKVLIILDDVDDRCQVDALAGGSDWFGHGSVIFVTTRKKKVFKECGLSEGQIYKASGMEASSSSAKFEFDVFLSFRGKDTRKGFTGHLYDRLKLHGVSAFKDSEDLEKGKEINKLLDYIKGSMIFMPIFSKRYAESKWCLKEISMMVACERLIIPVFFDVEPKEVSDQIEHFAPAFERYERDARKYSGDPHDPSPSCWNRFIVLQRITKSWRSSHMDQEEVSNWRHALKTVGKLNGFHLKNDTDGDEAKLVRLILKRLLREVRKLPYQLPEHLIGVDAHVHEVKKLGKDGNTVQFIGIHGMGGIGKTTIAKSIYNDLFLEFDGSSFLFDIRENFEQHKELELQRQLTREILKVEDPQIYSVEDGKNMIQNRMNSKKVLIILDDIDDGYQLDALAGGRDWFGHGSMIFITTRIWKVLKEHGLSEGQIYKVNGLNYEQSCYSFKLYAFKGREPEKGCRQLLDAFVEAGGGIPLALQMIGSTLSPQKKVQEWKYLLEKLQNIPDDRIQERLRISYDGLKQEEQKQIFLDISCFFIGKDGEKATRMWKACEFYPECAIPDLLSASLIDKDQHGEFLMHDLIRHMGREIVHQEAVSESWMRSRLWSPQDIFHLFRSEKKGVKKQGAEVLSNLKFLNLARTEISSIPDFTNVCCLEQLILCDCTKLTMIHESIGAMKSLLSLDLGGCDILSKIPDSVCELSSLKSFDLQKCAKVSSLPESLGNMTSLEKLYLDMTSIEILPDSIGSLTSLQVLSLKQCKLKALPASLQNLLCLQHLIVEHTFLNETAERLDALLDGEMEASLSSAKFEYDVFLSYKEVDTRRAFTSHLYEHMRLHGISTFIDSEDLEKGIQQSMIFMPIFSKGYVESRWCLK
ncbi:TMV resistance protein [Nymphaea thermarum]|nr:TMV resistance protein [Nymphaea thermarum]